MACTLNVGRKLPCKAAFGGIKTVLFANYGTIASIAVDSTTKEATITNGSPAPEWYQYDVKGNSSLETTVTSSRENGTTFYTQTLNLTLTFLDAKTQAELQVIAQARPYVVVVDYYGNNFLCGFENGMEVTGGTVVTGAAAGDLSGFTLTLEGLEETAPYFLSAAVTASSTTPIDPTP
jgi:hypothetical protein|tara:strand:- start:1607 stop:2140 length:534 start_codon:yes stop_codon:yes gene_type:complete